MPQLIAIYSPNGMEIIGKVDKRTDSTVTLNQPMVPRLIQQPGGAYAVALDPFSLSHPSSSVTFPLATYAVMDGDLPKDVEDGYLQTTSGIQLL